MAKGQSQAAGKNLATTNSVAAGFGTAAQVPGNAAQGGYLNLVENPGYSAGTKAAIDTTTLDANNAALQAAKNTATNRVARTGNDAGYATEELQMGKNAAETGDQQVAQNQITFANQAKTDTQQGLAGLSNLYGIDTGTMANLYGLGPATLNARAAGQNTGLAIAGDVIGAAGQVGAAAAGK